MTVRTRLVYRVVPAVFAVVLLVLLGVFGTLGASVRSSHNGDALGCLAAMAVLPALLVLKMILDAFRTLTIDDTGVRVGTPMGGRRVEWSRIGAVHVWTDVRSGKARPSFIEHAELRSPEGKRLLALKDHFDKEAYRFLAEQAEARKILVRRNRP